MSDMEAVNAFNGELQSLYDVKPPISKGKMTSVTKAALKGVKLYKHVVQSVEKFIQKCKTEYKIPGLYVIDSIIRQSRHQFGAEKDVFAPRFARNIQTTFMHLYKCAEEEKPKIIRVLNLWQKNKIFLPEVIHPLFDLADPNNPIWEQLQQNQEQQSRNNPPSSNNITPAAAAFTSLLGNLPAVPFKKEVLDYDYGDDDDGDLRNQAGGSGSDQNNPPSNVGLDALGSILANPEILRQLANLQEQIAAATNSGSGGGYPTPEQERQRKLAELNKQEAAFDQRLAQTVARLPFAVDCELPSSEAGGSRKDSDQNYNQLGNQNQSNPLLPPAFFHQINEQQQHGSPHNQQQQAQTLLNLLGQQQRQDGQNPFGLPLSFQGGQYQQQQQDLSQAMNMFNNQIAGSEAIQPFNQTFGSNNQGIIEVDLTDDRDKDRRDKRRKRSRERRSTSRSRFRRSRSRDRDSRDRKRHRSRSRDRVKEERDREREKEKERLRKGLPVIKKEHMSVCSTTLWVGHLSKLVSQEDLSDTFGAYGDIISIDLISPRGCAFIVMNRRQDALRALDRLKNTKLQGKSITVAWAPGKGMKGREWKDYWEIDCGVSYIPWFKLRPDTNLEEFEDGGCIDEETLPEYLTNKLKSADKDANLESENSQDVSQSGLASSIPMPLMSVGGLLGPMSDSASKPSENIDSALKAQTPLAPTMPSMHNAFGIPPVGMMPMGMVGMVPPPMMAPGLPFGGMMVPPGMLPGMMPPLGMPPAHGMMGELPPSSLGNMPQLNLQPPMIDQNQIGEKDDDEIKKSDRKRRSRFNDPDETKPTADEVNISNTLLSQDNVKDDRPVFERLKSLAEGYGGFGGNSASDKMGHSLLGAPGAMLGDRMPGPRGFTQSPLLPHGPVGNQFGTGFMGDSTGGPMGGVSRSWFDSANPFLNPNPNPFAGNPFVQSNLTENPFDIGAPSTSNEGPAPLFGNRPERNRFGGWGDDNNRSRGNSLWEDKEDDGPIVGRGRGRGSWRDDSENSRGRGGFRGRGRGIRDAWISGEGRERDDQIGRRDDRDRSRDKREGRNRRDSFRDRRNSRDDDRDRIRRSSDRQSEEGWDAPKQHNVAEDEDWETSNNNKIQRTPIIVSSHNNQLWENDNWEENSSSAANIPEQNQSHVWEETGSAKNSNPNIKQVESPVTNKNWEPADNWREEENDRNSSPRPNEFENENQTDKEHPRPWSTVNTINIAELSEEENFSYPNQSKEHHKTEPEIQSFANFHNPANVKEDLNEPKTKQTISNTDTYNEKTNENVSSAYSNGPGHSEENEPRDFSNQREDSDFESYHNNNGNIAFNVKEDSEERKEVESSTSNSNYYSDHESSPPHELSNDQNFSKHSINSMEFSSHLNNSTEILNHESSSIIENDNEGVMLVENIENGSPPS